MRVVVRVDAWPSIGIGHLMRCLALAGLLRRNGAHVTFISRVVNGHLCDAILDHGFEAIRLPPRFEAVEDFWQADAAQSLRAIGSLGAQVDLLVVDHYLLGLGWERALRARVGRVLVIDDLANRPHDCDLLLDQNLHSDSDVHYRALVPPGARIFVGPQYALLREEFAGIVAQPREKGVRRLLAYFGGGDGPSENIKVVRALRQLGERAPEATVVLGTESSHLEADIRNEAPSLRGVEILAETRDMAKLMLSADLALGTCGSAAWERCVTGLPTLAVITASNQQDDARILHQRGAIRNLGEARKSTVDLWVQEIRRLQDDAAALSLMSRAAISVMQGRGEAAREFEAALGI